MRLVKIIIPFSIFCFSFIFSLSPVKAANNVDFSYYGTKFGETIYNDFNDFLKDKGYEFILVDNNITSYYEGFFMFVFPKESFLSLRLDVLSSDNFRYRLYNFSDNSISYYTCTLYSNYYDSETNSYGKKKCIEKLNSSPSSVLDSKSYHPTDIGYFKSTSLRFPFYISNENIEFSSEGVNVDYGNGLVVTSENVTVKDLFYANHEGLFEEKQTVMGDVDLTNVEKLLYFICFMLFAFFIVLIFKIAIRFIHMILPI